MRNPQCLGRNCCIFENRNVFNRPLVLPSKNRQVNDNLLLRQKRSLKKYGKKPQTVKPKNVMLFSSTSASTIMDKMNDIQSTNKKSKPQTPELSRLTNVSSNSKFEQTALKLESSPIKFSYQHAELQRAKSADNMSHMKLSERLTQTGCSSSSQTSQNNTFVTFNNRNPFHSDHEHDYQRHFNNFESHSNQAYPYHNFKQKVLITTTTPTTPTILTHNKQKQQKHYKKQINSIKESYYSFCPKQIRNKGKIEKAKTHFASYPQQKSPQQPPPQQLQLPQQIPYEIMDRLRGKTIVSMKGDQLSSTSDTQSIILEKHSQDIGKGRIRTKLI